LINGHLRALRPLRRGADARQRIRHQDRRDAPGRDGTRRILSQDVAEHCFGLAAERMQHRDGALKGHLHRRTAGVLERDRAEVLHRMLLCGAGTAGDHAHEQA
jgi:hypothetical protein